MASTGPAYCGFHRHQRGDAAGRSRRCPDQIDDRQHRRRIPTFIKSLITMRDMLRHTHPEVHVLGQLRLRNGPAQCAESPACSAGSGAGGQHCRPSSSSRRIRLSTWLPVPPRSRAARLLSAVGRRSSAKCHDRCRANRDISRRFSRWGHLPISGIVTARHCRSDGASYLAPPLAVTDWARHLPSPSPMS